MQYKANEVKAGIVIVAALAVFSLLCYLVLDLREFFTTKMLVVIDFARAPGVQEGTSVRYAGVQKGKVIRYEFRSDQEMKTNYVRVVCQMDGVLKFSDRDRVYVEERLTGNVWIDIIPGAGGTQVEPQYLAGVSQNMEDKVVLLKAEPSPMALIFERTNDVLNDIKSFLEGEQGQNLKATIAAARAMMQDLGEAVKSAKEMVSKGGPVVAAADSFKEASAAFTGIVKENREDIRTSLQEISKILPDARKTLENLRTTFEQFSNMVVENRGGIKETVDNVRAASERLGELLNRVRDTLDAVGAVIAEDRPILKRTFMDMSEAVANFKMGIERLKAQPWLLIYRPKPEEMRQIMYYEAARNLLEAQGSLERDLDRLGGVGIPDSVRKEIVAEINATLENMSKQLQRLAEDMEKPRKAEAPK